MRNTYKLNKGFTLVEMLVAVSIFSISILAVMSVLASGISSTNYAKRKIAATYLAQEGIECIRNTRDSYVLYPNPPSQSWNGFRTMNAANFNAIDCPAVASGFNRTLSKSINALGPDEVKVFSSVSWTQGSGNYSITFSENLFNWTNN